MPRLLITAGRTSGKQDIINRAGISPRSPGLMKDAMRHLMTTGEENLRVYISFGAEHTEYKASQRHPQAPHELCSPLFHLPLDVPQSSLHQLWELLLNEVNGTAPCDHSTDCSGEKLAEYGSLCHFTTAAF